MSYELDGVDDYLGYTIPAGVALNDALTLLIVVRIIVTTDTTWLSLLEGKRSTGAVGCAMGRNNLGQIYFANTGSTIAAGSITDSDNWMIVAVTRTAAAASTAHKAPIGGSRTSNALGALADGLSLASGTMRIGGNEDFANIKVAAAAAWQSDIGTAGIDSILSAKTTQSIADLSPFWLVDDAGGFATNLVDPGVMDLSSSNGGTPFDADDPAGWVYGLGGGSQNVSPGHLASTAQIFAPTFAPGSVTVQPAHVASTAQVFAPGLAQVIQPGHVASTAQTFSPTLAPGSVTVQPGHLASTAQVFAPNVGGSTLIEPGHLASAAQVFAPSLAVGAVTVTPGHLASGAQVFTPTLTGGDLPEGPAHGTQVPTLGVG